MRTSLIAWATVVLLGCYAHADETAADRLFVAGALASLEPGMTITFEQSRTVPKGADLEPVDDGALTIEIGDQGTANVGFDLAERRVTLPPHPLPSGHPALLVFLETVRGSLAELSGGSPHYIKNRMIESFRQPVEDEDINLSVDGAEMPAERLVFRPFADDPNANQMGELAGLELRFVLSDTVPGGLHSLEAEAGAYHERFALEGAE